MGSFIQPFNLPFSGTPDVSALEWTTDIQQLGTLAAGVSDWRVHFVGIETRGPGGGASMSTNIATFQGANSAVTPGGYRPTAGNVVETGCCIGASSQYDGLTRIPFDKVFLWDNSASAFVDLTAAAADADSVGDITLLGESADFLYLGRTSVPFNPSFSYFKGTPYTDVGGTAGVGGGPIVISYFNGSWVSANVQGDTTNAFAKRGIVDIARINDWSLTTINSQSRYWLRVALTANASTTAVGTHLVGHNQIDGVRLIADATYPTWQVCWAEIDGVSNTGLQLTARDYRTLFGNLPETIKWRLERFKDEPNLFSHNLWRDGQTGYWRDLGTGVSGTGYTAWKLRIAISDTWKDVAFYYMPKSSAAALDHTQSVVNILQEFGHANPLSSNICRIDYGNFRAYDSVTRKWYMLNQWSIYADIDSALADRNYGFSVQQTTGKLTSLVGIAGVTDVNKKFLVDGVPKNGTTLAALPARGISGTGYVAGSIIYNGPIWTNGTAAVPTTPWVAQEYDRGYWLLTPSAADPATVVFTAPERGTYTITGSFGRANNVASGDGVDVTVKQSSVITSSLTTRHSGTLTQTNATSVNAADPFAGTSSNFSAFSLTFYAYETDEIRFNVAAKANATNDQTALKFNIAYQQDAKVCLTDLRAQRLPFPNAKVLTAIEWTQEVITYQDNLNFRGDFVILGMWQQNMFTKVHNLHHEFTPGDYQWAGHHNAISYLSPGAGIYWSAQFNWASGGTLYDGVAALADPNVAPNLAHVWEVVDGNAAQITSSQIYSRLPISKPFTVRWKMELMGSIVNPANVLRRDQNGAFLPNPLPGTYWIWKASNEIGGLWRDVANFYIPTDAVSPTNPFSIVQEWFFTPGAGQTLDGDRCDVRYSGMRLFDSSSGRWHECLEWKNVRDGSLEDPGGIGAGVEPLLAEEIAQNPHGFNPGIDPGKIAVRTLDGLHRIGQYVLSGLTYKQTNGNTLAYDGLIEEPVAAGSVPVAAALQPIPHPDGSPPPTTIPHYYTGPTWRGAGGLPYVQQECNRGFYIVHPDATEAAILVYTAPYDGTYYLEGDAARANPTISGDGATFSVVAPAATLYGPQVIAAANPPSGNINPDNPFANTNSNRNFNVSAQLYAGQQVEFRFSAGANQSFDATAFRVRISYVTQSLIPPVVPPSVVSSGVAYGTPTLVRYGLDLAPIREIWLDPGASSVDIYPAPFGDWYFEVLQLGSDGRPGDSAQLSFSFKPDQYFNEERVLDLVLTDGEGTEVFDWTNADLRAKWREPNLTYQSGITETPGGLIHSDSALDPVVRGFEIEAFDPDTEVLLRKFPEQTSRSIVYTADMQFVDQQRMLNRGLFGKMGLRVRMVSVGGLFSAWSVLQAYHATTPGISANTMQDHIGGDPFEAQVSNFLLFDGSGGDVDAWTTVVEKSVEVMGQPGGLPSLVAYGGIFSALVEEGGDFVGENLTGISYIMVSQPLKVEFRIVVNPGAGEIEVVRPGPMDVSANGYFVGGHGGNLDLRYAGIYTYALQLRWTREGYNEGLAKGQNFVYTGGRVIDGLGTHWLELVRPGDEIQIQSIHPTNWYGIREITAENELVLETDPGLGAQTFMAYRTRADVTEMLEPNLRMIIRRATITVKEDRLAGT